MKKSVRNTVVAGNWKMNLTPAEAAALINEMKPALAGLKNSEFVLCVPAVDIPAAVEAAKGTNIKIGGQNVHFKSSGAYTGEISAAMLTSCGAEYVIIGHSERRQYFGETDAVINLRVKAAIAAGLTVILCVGETSGERDQGITEETVSLQTKIALLGVTAKELSKVIIAYEPVWAIGTGRTATAPEADRVCGIIRGVIRSLYGEGAAEGISVQYGGSMNAANAAELLAMPNIDGGLIGGASLKASDFAVIARAAE